VCLPGFLELNANDFGRICGVHPYDVNDGSYIVEFRNREDAARYEKLAKKACKASAKWLAAAAQSEETPSSCPWLPQPSTGFLAAPPGLPQTQSLGAATSPSYEVELGSLPLHLMSQAMIEATLDQAGLEKDVIDISILKAGKVKITLSSEHAAEMCVEHFAGRKWNTVGPMVSATILSRDQGVSCQPASSSSLSKFAPAYVHSTLWKEPAPLAGASDASTTVSDEDVEELWEAEIKKVMSMCEFE